ncbi:MAG: long-chain acyl-CoA synthetase [Thermoleophilaceae bacterium]|jgi:long-chain acyl-CoA synthetase|nr:long-chain acyl-CoA synthetase [Thermoleophilaceae bacterium]MEA2469171.1 long-chain acyl-CoA synthetase [Thermoleophilaceae bacterium]
MTNLTGVLADTVAEHGDRTALKLDDLEIPYTALQEGSARVAGLLRARGVEPGDRVGLMLPNLPYFPFAFFGVLRVGAIVVPMNPLLKEREVAFHLSDSGAKVLLAWTQFAEPAQKGSDDAGAECVVVEPDGFEQLLAGADPVEDIAERDDDDTALILYTSGTTGTPKGAELTHENLRAATQISVDLVDAGPDNVTFGALPLFHVFGLTSGLNSAVRVGGVLTLLPRFDPGKALEIVQRDGVTTFLGVPTMYAAMLHHGEHDSFDTTSLDLCVSGGAAMPVEILRGFEEAFDCKVLEGYGMSETCAIAAFNRPDRERKPGSIGIPVPGVEMKLVDEDGNEVPQGEVGEILIRGPVVMKGYWNREDATAETIDSGGWLHSGDMATVDEDGFFFIVDRKKDMIIRGGFNVYPREIEEVFYEHRAVAEAAVVGVAHESLGEEVVAAVALKQGEEATADELRAYVKERVAAYKYPRHVWITESLPKGPTGKILKRDIEVPSEVAQS